MQIPFLHKQKKLTTAFAADSGITALRAVRLGVITLVAAVMGAVVLFLYRDFYQTIVQARAVIVLKQEVALENINLKLFKRVHAVHQYKIAPTLGARISDPFDTNEPIVEPVTVPEPEPAAEEQDL